MRAAASNRGVTSHPHVFFLLPSQTPTKPKPALLPASHQITAEMHALKSSSQKLLHNQAQRPACLHGHPCCGAVRPSHSIRWQQHSSTPELHQVAVGQRRLSSWVAAAQQGGGLGDEDGVDVAVFRFTLGIPGFEDRFIPRVVGAAAAALMALNHVLGAQPAPAAQVRAEFLCLALAALCVVVPEVEERLKEALPGRGRQGVVGSIKGSANGFALAPMLSDKQKQELAWSSVSLIKNTNTCGVILISGNTALMARGALSSSLYTPGQAQATLDSIAKASSGIVSSADISKLLRSSTGSSSNSKAASQQPSTSTQLYLADRAAMRQVVPGGWPVLPEGAESVLVQQIPGAAKPSYMLVYSERARALSDRERKWIAALASKLGPILA